MYIHIYIYIYIYTFFVYLSDVLEGGQTDFAGADADGRYA